MNRVDSHLKFCKWAIKKIFARRLSRWGLNINDAIQESYVALLETDRRDCFKDSRHFRNYLMQVIRRKLIQLRNRSSVIRVPESGISKYSVFRENARRVDLLLDTPQKENESVATIENMRALRESLRRLSSREIAVLYARFGISSPPLTYEEAGRKFKVTRERVRQIEMKAIRKLSHPSTPIGKLLLEMAS